MRYIHNERQNCGLMYLYFFIKKSFELWIVTQNPFCDGYNDPQLMCTPYVLYLNDPILNLLQTSPLLQGTMSVKKTFQTWRKKEQGLFISLSKVYSYWSKLINKYNLKANKYQFHSIPIMIGYAWFNSMLLRKWKTILPTKNKNFGDASLDIWVNLFRMMHNFFAQSEIQLHTVSAESFISETTTEALMPLSKAANKMKDEKDALDDSYEKWVCVKALEDIKHLNVCRWNQYLDTSALADRGLFSIVVLPVRPRPSPYSNWYSV